MPLKTINPTSEEIIKEYPEISREELEKQIEKSHEAFIRHKRTSFSRRAELFNNLADLLEKRKNRYGRLISEEMGKPLDQAEAETVKCAFVCRYYAENAEKFLERQYVETNRKVSYISYRPLGVLLAIMPWNFPFWQVLRFAAPYIMAGNTCLLKHSNNTTGSAIAIEEAFRDAGFTDNVFKTLLIDVDKVESVIKHPLIKGISLTGSTRVGKIVAGQAAEVMKKCVFELGGSDPYVILDDADLEAAADILVNGRYYNGGQTCISPKRIIASKKIAPKLTELIVARASEWKCGDPLENRPNTVGPIARKDLLEQFEDQIRRSVEAGAECKLGGKRPDMKGYFYLPTVLTGIDKNNPAYSEEFFGPAICVIETEDEEEAVRTANDSCYGLGGAVFSKDVKRAERIAENDITAGAVAVNGLVKSDPRLPFGGVNDSGYGREIGVVGIREFVNIKSVCID